MFIFEKKKKNDTHRERDENTCNFIPIDSFDKQRDVDV